MFTKKESVYEGVSNAEIDRLADKLRLKSDTPRHRKIFHIARDRGDFEFVIKLLQNEALGFSLEDKESALDDAAAQGNTAAVFTFLATVLLGSNYKVSTVFSAAASQQNELVIELIKQYDPEIPASRKETLFWRAFLGNNIQLASYLLKHHSKDISDDTKGRVLFESMTRSSLHGPAREFIVKELLGNCMAEIPDGWKLQTQEKATKNDDEEIATLLGIALDLGTPRPQ